jgi:hypothetical protein
VAGVEVAEWPSAEAEIAEEVHEAHCHPAQ